MQVVINTSHSNFAISEEAVTYIRKKLKVPKTHLSEINAYSFDYDRSHPLLIEVINKLGHKADGLYATLKIVEIPNNVSWKVMCDTSGEYVAEEHRIWR
jgi:hypothetical protein